MVYTLRFFFSSNCSLFHNSNVLLIYIYILKYIYSLELWLYGLSLHLESLVCGQKHLTVALCHNFEEFLSEKFASRISPDPARKLSANLYDIYYCCVSSEKQFLCQKHAEFYSKNKFQELVHLVGFIIRMYHDARSPERQTAFN